MNLTQIINSILYGKGLPGYILYLFAMLIVIVTISLNFGLLASDSQPEWFSQMMLKGGILLIIMASIGVGIMSCNRANAFRGNKYDVLNFGKAILMYGGGESSDDWGQHPYYVTGSNENTKTVSDNYLPTH